MKKFLIAFTAVVALVGFAMVNNSMAAPTVNVYSAGTTAKAAPYFIANERYRSATALQAVNQRIFAVIGVNNNGPSKAEFAMTNANPDSATSSYVLAVWDDSGGKDGIVQAGELLVVTNNDATSPIIGSLVDNKITFIGALGFTTATNNVIAAEATKNAQTVRATESMLIVELIATGTYAQIAETVQLTAFSHTAAAANPDAAQAVGNGVIGFNYTPSSGLSDGDSVSMTYTEGTASSTPATVATLDDQYIVGVDTGANNAADGIIDVNEGRLKFTGGGQADTIKVEIGNRDQTNTIGAPFKDSVDRSLQGGLYHIDATPGNGSVKNVLLDLVGSNQAISSVKVGTTTITYDTTNGRWRRTMAAPATAGDATFDVTTDGTSVINTRTFTAAGTSDPNSGFQAINYGTGKAAGAWTLNGYQAIIPFLDTRTTVPTFCVLNNADTIAATVFFDVLASEGTTTGLQGFDLGTIAAGATALITFSGETVTLAGSTAVAVATGTDKRYSGKVVVTANINNVSMDCVQTDPVTGQKRKINVLTEEMVGTGDTGQRWHQ